MMTRKKDTFSSYVALDDVNVFKAAESDAIALLAHTWNDDLDTEVSAQLVQASALAYLSFGRTKEKVKAKQKVRARADILFRPSHLSLEDRQRRLKNVMLVVDRDIGDMIAKVQCLLPARPHKIRHVQLVWRHDNNLPTKRIRLECVS